MFIPANDKEKGDWEMASECATQANVEGLEHEAVTLFHYAAFRLAQMLGVKALRHFEAAVFAGKGMLVFKELTERQAKNDNP